MENIEAKDSVGKMVMSFDPGYEMINNFSVADGPWKLLKVTKAGLCILEGYEEFRVKPTNIVLYKEGQSEYLYGY